jgi:hypothetical protein
VAGEQQKRELIERAKALKATSRTLKQEADALRQAWQASGRVAKPLNDILWKEFKAAIDAAFRNRPPRSTYRYAADETGLRDLARRVSRETKCPPTSLSNTVSVQEEVRKGIFRKEVIVREERSVVIEGWRLYSRKHYELIGKPQPGTGIPVIGDTDRQLWLSISGDLMTVDKHDSGPAVWTTSYRVSAADVNDVAAPDYLFRKKILRSPTVVSETFYEFRAWKDGPHYLRLSKKLVEIAEWSDGTVSSLY